jgi:hypothetical protein
VLGQLVAFMCLQISEMLLGPSPTGFTFTPKHKSSSYSSSAAAGNRAPSETEPAGGGQAGQSAMARDDDEAVGEG